MRNLIQAGPGLDRPLASCKHPRSCLLIWLCLGSRSHCLFVNVHTRKYPQSVHLRVKSSVLPTLRNACTHRVAIFMQLGSVHYLTIRLRARNFYEVIVNFYKVIVKLTSTP